MLSVKQYAGPNTTRVMVNAVIFYFSYETIVAFVTLATGYVVCENCWGRTTGIHINAIDGGDKKRRLKYEDFQKQVEALISKISVNITKD